MLRGLPKVGEEHANVFQGASIRVVCLGQRFESGVAVSRRQDGSLLFTMVMSGQISIRLLSVPSVRFLCRVRGRGAPTAD